MKLMNEFDIPDFINEIVATGCQPAAIGAFYVIGDADLPEPHCELVQPLLRQIGAKFGERDHLVEEISAYLRSIGRFFPIATTH